MAESIGQLALSIADGMPECCNDQLLGRTYEFEPQELEAFAQALVAQWAPDGCKLVIDPSRDCVLSNDDYHEAEIIEMGKRLFSAVDAMCAQAGTETNETVEWLCGEYGGMAKLFLKYFSPAAPAQGQEADLRRQLGKLLEALGSGGRHCNDDTPHSDLCEAIIDSKEAYIGQGLDPYWKWAFRCGFHEAELLHLKNAERYLWLRDKGCGETLEESILVINGKSPDFSLLPEELDAAIDAAMAASKEGGAV